MNKKTLIIITALILGLSTAGGGYYYYQDQKQKNDQIELALLEAKNKFDAEHYTEAFKAYRSLAEQGNAKAQFQLYSMYNSGQGTGKDLDLAAYWLKNLQNKDLLRLSTVLELNIALIANCLVFLLLKRMKTSSLLV
ncbi:hypothetical protein [Ursidibacter sp. B-7004-1]